MRQGTYIGKRRRKVDRRVTIVTFCFYSQKRSCGKHKCNQTCCVDIEHTCSQRCSSSLNCGRHRCEQLCHRGKCGRCLRSSKLNREERANVSRIYCSGVYLRSWRVTCVTQVSKSCIVIAATRSSIRRYLAALNHPNVISRVVDNTIANTRLCIRAIPIALVLLVPSSPIDYVTAATR